MTDELKKNNLNETVEALIFASEKPISMNLILEILNSTPAEKENKIKLSLLEDSKDNNETHNELSFDEVMKSDLEKNSDSEKTEIDDDQKETSTDQQTENFTEGEDRDNKNLSLMLSETDILTALESIKEKYNSSPVSAINLMEIGESYQFRTNPIYGKWIKLLQISKPVKLTKAALETLAVLAYKQPITKPEIDVIRGVDSGYTIRFLLEKKLARILGKKDIPGKPLLYGTSNEFLSLFSLKNLSSLPTLREFRELTDKHAEKVNELFSEPTIEEIKQQGTVLDKFSKEDEENIAEIDRALSESRKAKSVISILNNELFKEEDQEEGADTDTNSETDERSSETDKQDETCDNLQQNSEDEYYPPENEYQEIEREDEIS